MIFKALMRFFSASLLLVLGLNAPAHADTINIVGFGDSLMAGYQLPADAGFPERLEQLAKERGYDVAISNAGVSGDTTSGGLARIDWSVPDGTKLVILELGGNDALRGISPAISRNNLTDMLDKLKSRNIDAVLVGMLAPPNMGAAYGDEFNAIYPELAEQYDVPLYPFFLDGVIEQPELMLPDGIHPNVDGVNEMVERFWPTLETWLSAQEAQ